MNFANPIWLYGLLGLAIPIIIHLWSKKEGKTIKVGSIKFYPESETRQSRRLYPNEFLLLALRCLLIAFLVLLIAQPILIGKKKKERPTVLIESALITESRMGSILDTLLTGEYEVRMLQTGFPNYEDDWSDSNRLELNYWSLLKAAYEFPSNELIVFAANRASAFQGRLPQLSKKVSWYGVPPKNSTERVIQASAVDESYYLTLASFDEGATSITRLNGEALEDFEGVQTRNTGGQVQVKTASQTHWVDLVTPEAQTVEIAYEPEFELDAKLWQAAFLAIEETNGIPLNVSIVPANEAEGNTDIQVWLSNENQTPDGTFSLIFENDPLSVELLRAKGGNVFQITRRLSLESITAEDVSEELLNALWLDQDQLDLLAENDRRMLPTSMISPVSSDARASAGVVQSVPHFYWLIFMGLLALERFVSLKRKQ